MINTGGRPGANRPGFSRLRCIEYVDTLQCRRGVDVGTGGRLRFAVCQVRSWRLSVHGSCGRPAPVQAPIWIPAQNRDLIWAHSRRLPGCALPALYECRLHSLMVASVVLRRSAAARKRALPDSLGRGPFTGFPWVMRLGWSSVGLCGDIRGCVCPSARGAAGSKQSAASPAELAPQGALAAKAFAPTTVLTREIVPGTGQRRGLGAQEAQCGYLSPRCGPGDGKARYWHREFRGPISTAFHVLSQGKGVGN